MLKVGPHFMTGGTGLGVWLAAGCTTVKFCFAFPGDDVRGAMLVGRSANTDYISPDGDPIARARAMFFDHILPTARANSRIVIWEGANEPAWSYDWSPEQMAHALRWYGEFDYAMSALGKQHGLTMVIGNWAVTTPGRTGSDGQNLNDLWQHYRRGLQATVDNGAIIGRHCYGPLDETFALRHRPDYRQMAAMGYKGVRVLLTEVGAENVPGMRPWREHYGSAQLYFDNWIEPFERAIREDPYVIGAHLFTLGTGADPKWEPYDVAGAAIPSMMVDLSDRLGAIKVPTPPPSQLPSADYIVKAGDTLIGIARRYNLRWRDIAVWNRITNPHIIRVGQRIRLTAPFPAPPTPSGWTLKYVSAADWGRKPLHAHNAPTLPVLMVPLDQRDTVVVHHTVTADSDATPNTFETEAEVLARVRAIDRFHGSRGFGGVGYSYLLAPMADRTLMIIEGRGESAVGVHAGNQDFNRRSIGLAWIGDYRRPFDMGETEWRGVMEVVNAFMRSLRVRLPNLGTRRSPTGAQVWGHRQVPGVATICPGDWLQERLTQFEF